MSLYRLFSEGWPMMLMALVAGLAGYAAGDIRAYYVALAQGWQLGAASERRRLRMTFAGLMYCSECGEQMPEGIWHRRLYAHSKSCARIYSTDD